MIVLGRILAPFGVLGWVKVRPFGDDPLEWRRMPQWWLGRDADAGDRPDAWVPYTLAGCKVHGKGIVAAFKDVDDRSAAEALEGAYIAVPREALPKTGKDEYYWGDLIGLAVVNAQGVALGAVTGLIETGAHDVLQVAEGEHERLIPFVAAYVKNVDVPRKRIVVEWEADW